MEASMFARNRQDTGESLKDLAHDFIEQDVGHHCDWKKNWERFKADYKTPQELNERIQRWLQFVGSDADPAALVEYLDKMSSGKWR